MSFSPPPHLKHSKKVLFLSISSEAWGWLCLVLWEQAAGGNQTLCAPLPTGSLQETSAQVSHRMSLHEFAIEHVPHLCKTTIWGFFWRYWHQSMGCKVMSYLFSFSKYKVGFRIWCFLQWRVFYCGIWLLAHQVAIRKKKITILLINLGCTSGAHSVPASWLESERWVAWCRWSGNLMPGNF